MTVNTARAARSATTERASAPASAQIAGAERAESRLRRVLAAIVATGFGASILGGAWDIQWHAAVGRDHFFIPPHMMLYSGVLVAGFVTLGLTLRETLLYRRGHPGVNDGNTVPVFGFFRGPLGFVLCGFGMLAMLASAPLDDYWHAIYGIDVTVWAPFHIMGILGASIGGLGLLYAVASEANREQVFRGDMLAGPRPWGPLTLAVLATLAFVLPPAMIVVLPAALQWPTTEVAGVAFLTYPVLLALLLPPVMIAAVRFTGRVGAATVVALLFTALRLLLAAAPAPLVSWLAAAENLPYRPYAPDWPVLAMTYPAWMLAGALAVDLVYALAVRRMGRRAFSATLPAVAAGTIGMMIVAALDRVWFEVLARGTKADYAMMAIVLGYLLTMLVAPVTSWIGKGLGGALRVVRQ